MGLFQLFNTRVADTKRQEELAQAYATISSALEQQKQDYKKAQDCGFFKDDGPTSERVRMMADKFASSECNIYRGLATIFGKRNMEIAFEKFYADLPSNVTPATIKTAENLKGKIWRPTTAVELYDEYAAASVAIKIHDHGVLLDKQIQRLKKIRKGRDPLPPLSSTNTASNKKLSL